MAKISDIDWAQHIKMDYAQNLRKDPPKKQLLEDLKKTQPAHFQKDLFIISCKIITKLYENA